MSAPTNTHRLLGIAVDGGGTKTSVVVHDSDGAVLGKVKTGPANPNSVGEDKAFEALSKGIEDALTSAGATRKNVARVCLGMSGADRPGDCRRFEDWARRAVGDHAACRCVNDGAIALSSATRGKLEGLVVIGGTGTVCLGFARGGAEERRAAGWGPLLGDEGSGHAIGCAVLKAVCWSVDGRGPKTALLDALLAKVGVTDPMELITWAYSCTGVGSSWNKAAEIAPLALECAAAGDAVACSILDAAASALMTSIRAVAVGLGYTPADDFDVVLAGGLLAHEGSLVALRLRKCVLSEYPKARVLIASEEPVMGAVYLNVAASKSRL
eukprot:m51a1_g11792 hypothetical protein (326) ;mRNA; f:308919-310087